MKQIIILFFVEIIPIIVFAQDSTKKSPVTISGFIDFYYQYDLNKPTSKERPVFLYNYKRHNEFNINLALIKAAYENKKVKASIGLMAGNYPQYNLATEPSMLQYIYEANLNYSFSNKLNMDAGVLPSHIGLESAISKDNWTLSRSILAENSPYFETGIKLNYLPDEKWLFSFLLLNGWQNIQETNPGKAIGTQLQYKPSEKWLLNSSTFIGNEKPDSAKEIRLFHNLYFTGNLSKKINTAFLFDIGKEGNKKWMGLALFLKYAISKDVNTTFRIEYYDDKYGVIIQPISPTGFKISGISNNIDFNLIGNIFFRLEARLLHSANKQFIRNSMPVRTNISFLGSIAVAF